MLTTLRTSGLTSGEIRRLDRSDVSVVDGRLRVRIRGKSSRLVTVGNPALVETHTAWLRERMFCSYPAYFTTLKSGRMLNDQIFRVIAQARKSAPRQ